MPDPFETFGVEASFDLDVAALAKRHRSLSGALHPDRYVGRPAAERRMALDRAIDVNAAWRILRDPVRRAEALLQRHGVSVGEGGEPQASPALLMQMMEVREALAEASAAKDLDKIGDLAERMRDRERSVAAQLLEGFRAAGADADSLTALLPILGEMRYLRRFFEEVEAIEEQLVA